MSAAVPSTVPLLSRLTRRGLTMGVLLILGCALPLLAGCPKAGPEGPERPEGVLPEGTTLSLVVVGDPSLATAIERLQGEWNALTGAGLKVERMSAEKLADAETLNADAVICSPCHVADVAAKAQIVRVPEGLTDGPAWSDVFSLLRTRQAVWGQHIMGVPFGSPVFVVYYREDLLKKLGRRPPETWAEYQELAELLADRKSLGNAAPPEGARWSGAIEPLGPGWAGLVLLARAAPYARHRENYSTMFSIDTMEPLIDGPPFVRALNELVKAASTGTADQLTYDPAAVRAAFWKGECGLALTWPSAAKGAVPDEPSEKAGGSPASESGLSVGLAALPGSEEAYDVGEKAWEARPQGEDTHVPLLGTAGRMGFVLRTSRRPEAAFRLLFWLSDEQSVQVCPASPATTLFRKQQLESPQSWVEAPMPRAAAARYAEITDETLSGPQWLFPLRLPGRDKYLAALDEAVQRAVRGDQTAEASLRQAAAAWRTITDELGRDAQREAYWKSLGLK
jgi:multiple sugar transport system substrate-binding protein